MVKTFSLATSSFHMSSIVLHGLSPRGSAAEASESPRLGAHGFGPLTSVITF